MITFQPASTSSASSTFMSRGSWWAASTRGAPVGRGRERNSGSCTAACRAFASARSAPSAERSLGSEPKPMSGRPSGPSNTAWTPSPAISVDLGSSTPLQGMWDV